MATDTGGSVDLSRDSSEGRHDGRSDALVVTPDTKTVGVDADVSAPSATAASATTQPAGALGIERMSLADLDPARRGARGTLVDNYINFCRSVGVDAKDSASLVKMLIVCTKSIDRRDVYRQVHVADPYLDWDYVERMSRNEFGGVGPCLEAVSFLSMPDIDVAFRDAGGERENARRLAVHRAFVQAVEASGLTLSLEDSLRMSLLYNLSYLNGSVVLEQYVNRCTKKACYENILKLIANFADQRFTVHDYSVAITWLMERVKVTPEFQREVQLNLSHRDSMQSVMKLRYVQECSGRPRLSLRLRHNRGVNSVTTSSGSVLSGESMDTFEGWCTRVRFPNTVSSALRYKLYVIMSQPRINHERVVRGFTNSHLATAVLAQPVARPEANTISQVIESLEMRMAAFPELVQFMRTCFRAFAQRNLDEMTAVRYMQLYFAAYQHADLWRTCWTNIYPLLSYQVIRDVEEFTSKTPLNEEAFVQILKTE